MTYKFQVTQQEFEFIFQARNILLVRYAIQEVECQQCKKEHPCNYNPKDVYAKVSILNTNYSTRVPVDTMVSNITNLATNKGLDKLLLEGDLSIITNIAYATSKRDNFSFATKYCALLVPDKYPIYDNLVWKFFCHLNKLGFFDKATKKKFTNVNKNGSKAYNNYVDIYNEFIDKSGMRPFFQSYRKVDEYIWGAIKIYLLLNTQSNHTTTSPAKEWLKQFSAATLASLTSTAIWHIISQIKF